MEVGEKEEAGEGDYVGPYKLMKVNGKSVNT